MIAHEDLGGERVAQWQAGPSRQPTMRKRRYVLFALAILIFSSWPVCHGAEAQVDAPPAHYAGWAVEAYPEASAAEIEAIVRRLTASGANVVWIGHNNPGEADADKVEPGLSYAVYEASLDPANPRHADAVAIVEAQHRMLAACRAVGVKAVLPVGYQIQMGSTWNGRHPADLRRDAEGRTLDIYGGGVSASFYAPSYRRDIEAYYRWVDGEFVEPYADVILMLNLADEPIGGDYSVHAEAEFRRTHGFGFADIGDDPARQRLLGEFQSRYVVEYAIYSAGLWKELHPGLPVTISFDGAQARQTFTMPDVEALFRDTPSNFVVTFDAYPRDGLPSTSLSDADLVGLFLLTRSVGLYSARYAKPVWLWAAANSWGLSQASPDPGTVSDAVANGLYLALLAGQGGGELQGIAFWNYNVKEQGLYNDTHETSYEADTMFARVSAALPLLRQLMDDADDGSPSQGTQESVLILSPPARPYERIGAAREAVLLEVQPYRRLAILAKEGVNTAIVSSLDGWPLEAVRTIVVLSPAAAYVSDRDLALLRSFLARGGKVVTSPGVGAALSEASPGVPKLNHGGLVVRQGNLYMAQQGIAVLFEDRRHEVLSGFWQEVLGLAVPQPGYRIVTDRYVFHYHLGSEPAAVSWELPFEAIGVRYDDEARPVGWIHGSTLTATLGRREYIVLQRVRLFWPWICLIPLELRGVGKEGGHATRVPEQHVLVGTNLSPADEVQQPDHGLARVDRVEQNALGARYQADHFSLGGGQYGVAGPLVAIVDMHILRTEAQVQMQTSSRGSKQGKHRLA
jgi:hypothetical protein